MPITEIPGHKNVLAKFGAVTAHDFKELRTLSAETCYNEDREAFEKSLAIVLRGPKGSIEYRFSNVTDFKLSTLSFLGSFDVSDIRDRQLERKNFYFSDYEAQQVFGYAEIAEVSVCENPYV
jgi:hypothetical protein